MRHPGNPCLHGRTTGNSSGLARDNITSEAEMHIPALATDCVLSREVGVSDRNGRTERALQRGPTRDAILLGRVRNTSHQRTDGGGWEKANGESVAAPLQGTVEDDTHAEDATHAGDHKYARGSYARVRMMAVVATGTSKS